jgi:pyruvate kinase
MSIYGFRKTKIIATLGPATDSQAVLEEVVRRGADVVRVNFSHGEAADHRRRVEGVRRRSPRGEGAQRRSPRSSLLPSIPC